MAQNRRPDMDPKICRQYLGTSGPRKCCPEFIFMWLHWKHRCQMAYILHSQKPSSCSISCSNTVSFREIGASSFSYISNKSCHPVFSCPLLDISEKKVGFHKLGRNPYHHLKVLPKKKFCVFLILAKIFPQGTSYPCVWLFLTEALQKVGIIYLPFPFYRQREPVFGCQPVLSIMVTWLE